MTNEISTITTSTELPKTLEAYQRLTQAERNNITGQGNTLSNSLPQLKVNYDTDVEVEGGETIDVPKGQWKITVRDVNDNPVTAYSKKATIRIFMKRYRWAAWNATDAKYELMSSLFSNWGDPVVDNLGHEFAGGKFKKGVPAINPKFDPIGGSTPLKCQQVVYCLVTLDDAKDMNGDKVVVTDVPASYIAKGSAFGPISDLMEEFSDKGRDSGNWAVSMTLKREKNGSVTYFVPVPVVEDEHIYTDEEYTTLTKFGETVNFENLEVLAKYRKVIENKVVDTAAGGIIDGSDLSNDFDDELPEEMQVA